MTTLTKHQKKVQWRLRPPGAAQQHLENLFSTGEIRKDMTPTVCYNRHDVFKPFSLDVFKKNFYATKDKLGCMDDDNRKDSEKGEKYDYYYLFDIIIEHCNLIFIFISFAGVSIEKENTEDHGNEENDCIVGIGEEEDIKKALKKQFEQETEEYKVLEDKQPMVSIGKWIHPITFEEKYTVLIVLPSGVSDGDVVVPAKDDGTDEVLFSYPWTEEFVNINELYEKELTNKTLSISHPEIMAMKESLRDVKHSIDDIPKSVIKIKLPVKVQTSHHSYEHDTIVTKLKEGNHLVTVRIRLTAFDSNYIVTSAKKKIKVTFT